MIDPTRVHTPAPAEKQHAHTHMTADLATCIALSLCESAIKRCIAPIPATLLHPAPLTVEIEALQGGVGLQCLPNVHPTLISNVATYAPHNIVSQS